MLITRFFLENHTKPYTHTQKCIYDIIYLRSPLDNLAISEDNDLVCADDRRESMSDDDCGSVLAHLREGVLDVTLRLGVQRWRRLKSMISPYFSHTSDIPSQPGRKSAPFSRLTTHFYHIYSSNRFCTFLPFFVVVILAWITICVFVLVNHIQSVCYRDFLAHFIQASNILIFFMSYPSPGKHSLNWYWIIQWWQLKMTTVKKDLWIVNSSIENTISKIRSGPFSHRLCMWHSSARCDPLVWKVMISIPFSL